MVLSTWNQLALVCCILRLCNTAAGYLRMYLFDTYELDTKQKAALLDIVWFVVNVYVPVFVQTNMHPTVPDGPSIILTTRDLMKDYKVPDRVKNIFLDHAVT